MKTRHLHKKLRSFGLSKHDARKVTAMARSAGITNAEALEVFSAVMLIVLYCQMFDRLAELGEREDIHEY